MCRLTRRAAALVLPLAALHCRAEPPPCPACPSTTAAAAVAPAASAAAADRAGAGGAAAAPDENPWCERGEASYGGWTATPEQVLAAARKLKAACAPTAWFVQAVGDCMHRLGQSNVKVMAGVMSGEQSTPGACVLSANSVEWHGRRWVAFANFVRDNATFYEYVSAFELKSGRPVQATAECLGVSDADPGPGASRLRPEGWKSFPEDLRLRLCGP